VKEEEEEEEEEEEGEEEEEEEEEEERLPPGELGPAARWAVARPGGAEEWRERVDYNACAALCAVRVLPANSHGSPPLPPSPVAPVSRRRPKRRHPPNRGQSGVSD